MKRTVTVLLTFCLLVGLCFPAYAAEDDPTMDQPIQQEQEKEPIVVDSLEGLQAAIDAAEDGDTIAVDATIIMSDGDSLITDKHITVVRHGILEKTGGRMFEICGNGIIRGFSFVEDGLVGSSTIETKANGDGEIIIENCSFKAAGDNSILHFIAIGQDDSATIRGCTFYTGNGYILYSHGNTNVLIDSSKFLKGNYYGWFMIAAYGDMAIENCTFEAGTGYITATLEGKVTISNCEMATNFFKNRIYPNVYLEYKISGAGIISILDEPTEGEGFYDLFTGEKVELPINDIDDLSVLSYMTDKQAAEYFADENHIGWFDIKVDERNERFDEDEWEEPDTLPDTDPEQPTEQPQEPGDQTEGEDTTDEDQPPQEPTQPPEGEGTDNPADNTDQDTSQQPQEPADSDNSKEDDYTPPTDHRPSQRPSRPSTSTTTPAETNQPQEQPNNQVKPQLVCNGATIDASRTIVMLGYGDGLLHEDDSLTRAQLATVIYRLLDEESIAPYGNTGLAFVDVAADSWYAPYVNVIQAAGIVNGVGGGMYDPEGLVCWNQILAILSRFVEPQEYALQHIQYSGWAQEAIQTAVALNWIEDSADFDPDAVISRGELVQLVNSVLELYRE